jgi:hypothetical protein
MAGFTSPYRQHAFIGDHATSGAATTFFETTLGWGTLGASVGLGVQFFNTGTGRVMVWNGTAWSDITASTPTLANVLAAGNSAGSYTIDMNTHKITGLLSPDDATDAANKSYVDSVASGLAWKQPVKVINLVSDADTSHVVPTGVKGETHIANNWEETPTLYTDGHMYEWSGTVWTDLGAIGAGTRAVITGLSGTAAGSFTGHGKKFAQYSGSAWSFVAAVDADAVIVSADGSLYENWGYVYSGSVWVQFTGAGQINAGAGLTKDGNTLNIGAASTGAITVGSDDIAVNYDNSTIGVSGTGPGSLIVKNGGITATQLNASVAGNGITGGGGTALSVVAAATATKGGLAVDSDGVRSMQFYAGNPNTNVAGVKGEFAMDTTNDILYVCKTAGIAAAAVWFVV